MRKTSLLSLACLIVLVGDRAEAFDFTYDIEFRAAEFINGIPFGGPPPDGIAEGAISIGFDRPPRGQIGQILQSVQAEILSLSLTIDGRVYSADEVEARAGFRYRELNNIAVGTVGRAGCVALFGEDVFCLQGFGDDGSFTFSRAGELGIYFPGEFEFRAGPQVVAAVPEPTGALCFALAMGSFGWLQRRRDRCS